MHLNQVAMIGTVLGEMEFHQLKSGYPFRKFDIEYRRAAEPNKPHAHDECFTIEVTVWGYRGELDSVVKSGAVVLVAGRLHERRWTDGNGHAHWSFGITAGDVQVLGMARDPLAEAQAMADVIAKGCASKEEVDRRQKA